MKFLFDLGGVFFDWDPNYFFKNVFDDEERKYFLTEVCNDPVSYTHLTLPTNLCV